MAHLWRWGRVQGPIMVSTLGPAEMTRSSGTLVYVDRHTRPLIRQRIVNWIAIRQRSTAIKIRRGFGSVMILSRWYTMHESTNEPRGPNERAASVEEHSAVDWIRNPVWTGGYTWPFSNPRG